MHRRGFSRGSDRGARLFGHLARPAQLERSCDAEPRRRAGRDPPRASGDPNLEQSRYIEAAVCGILDRNIYAPNGNPWPGPKFDYKLAWMDRLHEHAQDLLDSGCRQSLSATSTSSRPSRTSTSPSAGRRTRCSHREARAKFRELVGQGWTDAIRHLHPDERIYTFWHYWRNSFQRDAGIRIDHALLSPSLAKKLKAAGVDRTPRGWEKTSDHAPMWVELEL